MFSQIFQKSFRRGADVLHAVRTAGFAADPDRLQVIWGAKTYILFVRYLRDIQRVEYVFCLLFRRYKEIVKIMFIKKNFFLLILRRLKLKIYLRDIQRVEYVFCLLFRKYKEIVIIMFIKKNFFIAYFKKVKIENILTRYPAGGVCFLSPV